MYTRREHSADELYTFNLTLCDNEIDRDIECFSTQSLYELAKLFLGKTGIFDHNPKGENQTARIFDTAVIKDESKRNSQGETYHYLQAKAYMVKSKKNEDMILDIDAGIKKEVSIGCTVQHAFCSICNTDTNKSFCEHKKGKVYEKKLCYIILDKALDAYEWSFVAVPAQKNAGVTKRYSTDDTKYSLKGDTEQILEKFAVSDEKSQLSPIEASQILEYIEKLKNYASLGKTYAKELRQDIVKMSFLCGESVDSKLFASIVEKMNIDELLAYKKAYDKKLSEKSLCFSQLASLKVEKQSDEDKQFKI